MKRGRFSDLKKSKFDAMVEEATIDCYNESEERTGWFNITPPSGR